MKKTFITFGVILAFIFILLSLLDHSEYALEKKLWNVQKQYNLAARDPKAVPEKEFEHIANQFRDLIKKYPKTSLTPKIYLQVGMTYILKGNFAKAREVFKEVIRIYPNDDALCAIALMNIGNTYESEKNGTAAIQIYDQVIQKYPQTSIGLNTPLYIANYYLRNNKKEEGTVALKKAETFYKKVIEETPPSGVEFNALRLLVTTYYAQEQWRDAVKILGKILLDYASSKQLTPDRVNLIVKSINTVSITKLKDYELPKNIYQDFIDKNPRHPLNKVLGDMITALKKLEEKGVIVDTKKPK